MKNPNGYGTVTKLSGNRRNPFVARKTNGWNDKGHPIYLVIGYFPTREAGMIALAEYNKSPWDIDAEKITLSKLFDEWSKKKLIKLGKSTQGSLNSAFKHTKPIWDMKYKDIKSFHMQDIIDNCGKSYATQSHIKNLFGQLDNFALEIDVINKSYAQLITAVSIPETTTQPFTEDEITSLWERQEELWVDSILVFLYTGFRISELLDLKLDSVDLDAMTLTGGTKTKSGKNRVIPIHSKIQHLIINRTNNTNNYLFGLNSEKISSITYYSYWNKIINNHTPHECRHTFRSKLDSANANKKCIDMLMGHKSKDVGERVYTHKTIDELREAIELIK
ncbi:MAG: tyrosine-type recombinase/integrase [Lachnospirales bacterium]